jgi:hypothetical protein
MKTLAIPREENCARIGLLKARLVAIMPNECLFKLFSDLVMYVIVDEMV